MKRLIFTAALCASFTAWAQPRIAFAIHGQPNPASLEHSYVGLVVTGAVAQVVVVEATTNLACNTWVAVGTNTLTTATGRFWLQQPATMAWTVVYDYDWHKQPCRFYRLRK